MVCQSVILSARSGVAIVRSSIVPLDIWGLKKVTSPGVFIRLRSWLSIHSTSSCPPRVGLVQRGSYRAWCSLASVSSRVDSGSLVLARIL